jgi:hypothetical protein
VGVLVTKVTGQVTKSVIYEVQMDLMELARAWFKPVGKILTWTDRFPLRL